MPVATSSLPTQPTASGNASWVMPATAVDGPFRLELNMPQEVWRTSDAISGSATLSYNGGEPTTIAASSQAVITFVYSDVSGEQNISYPISADCKTYSLDSQTPIEESLRMSALPGALDAHLSPGDWTVTAVAEFAGGPGAAPSPFDLLGLCRSDQHELRATLSVTVLD